MVDADFYDEAAAVKEKEVDLKSSDYSLLRIPLMRHHYQDFRTDPKSGGHFLKAAENDHVPGLIVIQRCGSGFHLGRVAATRHCSEEPLPGCDVGKL